MILDYNHRLHKYCGVWGGVGGGGRGEEMEAYSYFGCYSIIFSLWYRLLVISFTNNFCEAISFLC